MHLLVTVKCGQRESRFRIPCGNGQKTFKWLGLVSAARYSSESPKGSLRMRESRQAQAAGTALIPSNITTSDTSFFHPEALLGEQLEDGAEVCVALAPRVAVDAAGHPKTSRWSTIAFELSDPRKPFREQAMRDEYSAQEAKRTALEAMEADKRRGTMARKGSRLREVIKSQLPDRNAVHEAMHEDWFAMGKHRVLEALVADKQEQQKVKAVFTAHYVQLDELFKTYAASGSSIATAQEIEFNEFTEFVHNANLVAEGPGSQQVMHSCYNEANGDFSGGGRKSRGGPNRKVSAVASFHETKHIERPAFFNALLWFALFWAGHPDGQPDPLSRPGSSASGKPYRDPPAAHVAGRVEAADGGRGGLRARAPARGHAPQGRAAAHRPRRVRHQPARPLLTAAGRGPEGEHDAQGVAREREAGEYAHERPAVPLDARRPAAGVHHLDHPVVEGDVLRFDLGRCQRPTGSAGAEQREDSLAAAGVESEEQRCEATNLRSKVRAVVNEKLHDGRFSVVTRQMECCKANRIPSVDLGANVQKMTCAG